MRKKQSVSSAEQDGTEERKKEWNGNGRKNERIGME
jgi:hypothetical protein